MKPQNKQMHGRISPRRACNPCGYTMKMSSRYHRLLIYDVKRTTKIDGMGPFKVACRCLDGKNSLSQSRTARHYLCRAVQVTIPWITGVDVIQVGGRAIRLSGQSLEF